MQKKTKIDQTRNLGDYAKKGFKHTQQSKEKHYNWKGGVSKCPVCNKELSHFGKKYCQKHWPRPKGITRSHETRIKLSQIAKDRKGETAANWRGGIKPINEKIRSSKEYKIWKNAVRQRDDGKCIWCGSTNNIEIDHIKPFAIFPELRFAIDNGRTLCRKCHSLTPNWKGKGITKNVYPKNS